MEWIFKLRDFFQRKPSTNADNDIRKVYKNMLLLIIFSTAIMVICFYFHFKSRGFFEIFTILAVISAYYLSGCAIGFIFAIPKSAQGVRTPPPTGLPAGNTVASTDYYNDNTNLEEISDWLAKIIVGLGLTQFNYLRDMVESAANKMSETFCTLTVNTVCSAYFVFSYAIIIFYSVAGLIVGYLWTRIDFPKILTQNKRDLELIQKLEKQNQTMVNIINSPNTSADISQSESYKSEELYEKVKKIWNSKLVIDKSDIQKGRWGGKNIVDNIELSATVTPSSIPFMYKVKIILRITGGATFEGPVAILLHDSFKPKIRLLDAKDKNEVYFEILAYEAFTVAALTNIESETEYVSFELDLNEIQKLPEGFYWKK